MCTATEEATERAKKARDAMQRVPTHLESVATYLQDAIHNTYGDDDALSTVATRLRLHIRVVAAMSEAVTQDIQFLHSLEERGTTNGAE